MNTPYEIATQPVVMLVTSMLLLVMGGAVVAVSPKWHGRRETIKTTASRWDQRYHAFIQTYLDPIIIGRSRSQQMQSLQQGEFRDLSPPEKRNNYRLILGIGALCLLGVADLTAWPLVPVVIVMGLYTIWPMFQEAWRVALEERRFSLYHILLFYLCCLWIGGYYLVGTIGVIFTGITRKIELLSQTVTRNSLTSLLGEQPLTVTIWVEGAEREIPFEQLKVGDTLLLNAGQPVPIDGTIVKGEATIDQHRLTGESQPVEKGVGDSVLAATLVLGGNLQVQVEKTGEETAAARIVLVLNQTIEYQEVQIADKFRRLEVTRWPMLLGAGLGWLFSGPVTATALLGCNYLLSLVPLRLLTLLNGLKAAADRGILVKDGRALEEIAKVDTVVFDKTGTLTLDKPQVVAVYSCANRLFPIEGAEYSLLTAQNTQSSGEAPREALGETPEEKAQAGKAHAIEHALEIDSTHEVLWLAAAAEQRQSHPIAQAILAEAEKEDLQLPSLDDAYYQLGLGLTVQIQGQRIRVGSERFLKAEQLSLPPSLERQQVAAQKQGHTLVFVAVNDHLVGAIELAASLRPETKTMIAWLKEQNLALYILSGDQEAPTLKLANELGMSGYFANTLPEQKADRIRELQAQDRQVCFIGDGINDALALRQAEVSVSLKGATTVATDAAQIVLMDNDLSQLQMLWQLAERFNRSLSINTVLARGFSLVAAVGVILLPFKFWIVELLWGGQAITGITIACQPLLRNSD